MKSFKKRPRELKWYHAGAILYGDLGTSRLYVLGIAYFVCASRGNGHMSFHFIAAMCALVALVGWAYTIICRSFPDGGGVYTAARRISPHLAAVGALFLVADYVVTAALSSVDAFYYIREYLPIRRPEFWAMAAIAAIAAINLFGARKFGTPAFFIAAAAILFNLILIAAASPRFRDIQLAAPPRDFWNNVSPFIAIVLALSGIETISNLTGIMVEPVGKTSRRAIWPVIIEVVLLNVALALAMNAMPDSAAGGLATHKEDMLRAMGEHYVGHGFAVVSGLVFAFVLLSATNSAVNGMVSVLYAMGRDGELPRPFTALNAFGVPWVGLFVAAGAPAIVLYFVKDFGQLAELYAIGVVGAITINVGCTAFNRALPLKLWERSLLVLVTVVMAWIEIAIAVEKPHALLFALIVLGVGLAARYAARAVRRRRLGAPDAVPADAETLLDHGTLDSSLPKIMVASRGNPALLEYAFEEAVRRRAVLCIVCVKPLAVSFLDAPQVPGIEQDPEACHLFASAQRLAAEKNVPILPLYHADANPADIILDAAVTLNVDCLIMGVTQRGALWQMVRGSIMQQVADRLPKSTTLLIRA